MKQYPNRDEKDPVICPLCGFGIITVKEAREHYKVTTK